jgi:hypothetical protein
MDLRVRRGVGDRLLLHARIRVACQLLTPGDALSHPRFALLAAVGGMIHPGASRSYGFRSTREPSRGFAGALRDRSEQIVPRLVAQVTNLLPILIGFLLHAERLQHERAMVGYHGQRAFLLPLLLH